MRILAATTFVHILVTIGYFAAGLVALWTTDNIFPLLVAVVLTMVLPVGCILFMVVAVLANLLLFALYGERP